MKKIFKWALIITTFLACCSFPISNIVQAQANGSDLKVEGFNILPELTQDQIDEINAKIDYIWEKWKEVQRRYYESSTKLTAAQQIDSWIMNWDTIMNYLVFIVQFLSQLGLVVWAGFIIYAGYSYMSSSFSGWKVGKGKTAITNAIIWIIIVIFSYAIMRTLTSIIWLT